MEQGEFAAEIEKRRKIREENIKSGIKSDLEMGEKAF
jgi:hypothetical protein